MPASSKSKKTTKKTGKPVAKPASVKSTSSKAAPPKAVVPKSTAAKTVVPKATAGKATTAVSEAVPELPPAVSPELAGMLESQEARIKQIGALYAEIRTGQRDIERVVGRDLRALHRMAYKRQKRSGNRQPSGFVKPTGISAELAAFLGKPSGEKMARTEVTREINAYIREHKLQDKDNGRKINADAPLTKLLKLSKNEELTYFNLQKYMSPHFEKAQSSA